MGEGEDPVPWGVMESSSFNLWLVSVKRLLTRKSLPEVKREAEAFLLRKNSLEREGEGARTKDLEME